MNAILLVTTCLACGSLGRRVQMSSERVTEAPMVSMANLLLALHPESAFNFNPSRVTSMAHDRAWYTSRPRVLDPRSRVGRQSPVMGDEEAAEEPAAAPAPEGKTALEDLKPGDEVEGTVKNVMAFGAFVDIGATSDVLVHVSDMKEGFVEDANDEYKVGDTFKGFIKQVDPEKKQVWASYKEPVTTDELLDKTPLTELNVGDEIEGVVKNVMDFGAFVDVGAEADALLHVSQMRDERVEDATELYKTGDKITAKVRQIDLQEKKLWLTKRTQAPVVTADERSEKLKKYKGFAANETIEATIARIMPFGAFATLEEGVDGLIHVSQMSDKRVDDPSTLVSVGQKVKVYIQNVDLETGKLGLSMKKPGAEGKGAAQQLGSWELFTDIEDLSEEELASFNSDVDGLLEQNSFGKERSELRMALAKLKGREQAIKSNRKYASTGIQSKNPMEKFFFPERMVEPI